MRKVIFVASMMLLLMFIVYVAESQLGGERTLFGATFPRVDRDGRFRRAFLRSSSIWCCAGSIAGAC